MQGASDAWGCAAVECIVEPDPDTPGPAHGDAGEKDSIAPVHVLSASTESLNPV